VSALTAMPTAPARTGRAGTGAPRSITRHPRTFFDGAGGGPTLDDVVSGAWEELTAHAVVECPVCSDGELAPEYGELAPEYGGHPWRAHARPIGGRCRSCGTTLS
jgi:hypothetical protein